MKTLLALLLMALPALADVTKADVKKLLDAGISEKVIVEYVKTNAPVRMDASDLASLKAAGATEGVLTVLAQNMNNTPTVTYRTETVYIYQPYYGWYWSGWCWYPRHYYYYRPVVVRRPVVVHPPPAPVRRGHR